MKKISIEKQKAILYRFLKSCDSIVIYKYIIDQSLIFEESSVFDFLCFFDRKFGWWRIRKNLFLNNWADYYFKQIDFILFAKNYQDIFSEEDINTVLEKYIKGKGWVSVLREEIRKISNNANYLKKMNAILYNE